MSQVDRETSVPLDPTAEVSDVHDRLRLLVPALQQRLGELATTGATPAEKLELRAAHEHYSGVELLAKTALAALETADISLRVSPEEHLAGDAAYAAVRDFADSQGGGFTKAQLKEYLQARGFELPRDAKALSRQFADWQQQILAEKTEAGERRRWVRLGARTYALAWIGTPPAVRREPLSFDPPAVSLRPARTSEAEAPPPKVLTPEETSELALRLVTDSPNDHGGVLVGRLAEQAGIDTSGAWLAFNHLVDEGRLLQEKAGGAVFFRSLASEAAETPAGEEDPLSAAALRIVREASGEPAKTLVGRLVGEQNMSTPAARQVFERLVATGQIHRHNSEGRVRYSFEPLQPRTQPDAATTAESTAAPQLPTVQMVQAARGVLGVLTGKGVPFGKTFTLQEISQQLGWDGDPDNFDGKPDEVRAAANYLWSLGFVTRVETRGKLKLQLADRAIMRAMKSEEGRHNVVTLLSSGLKFVPPQKPARRPPARKKR